LKAGIFGGSVTGIDTTRAIRSRIATAKAINKSISIQSFLLLSFIEEECAWKNEPRISLAAKESIPLVEPF
jgi:hypothetical protein